MRSILTVAALVFSVVLVFLPLDCHAASWAAGKVTFVWQHYQTPSNPTAFLFQVDAAVVSRNACNTTSRWAVNATKAEGKAVMATVLTALAIGKRIYVEGTGKCDTHGDAETVSYLGIQ